MTNTPSQQPSRALAPLDELAVLLRPAGGGLYLVSTGSAEQKAVQRRYYGADSDDDVTEAFRARLARIATADVVVLGIPSDTGAGFRRGSNLGPQALRAALLAQAPGTLDGPGVVDIGDVFVIPQLLDDAMCSNDQLQRARAALYPDVDEQIRATLPVSALSIAQRAWQLVFALNPRARPVTLGGDHSTAWPVVAAMHEAGRRFCIVQVDAHTDLLAERLGVRMCFATWSYHANELLGRSQRLLQVGIRATRFPRAHWEGTLDVRQWWAADVLRDPTRALDEIVAAARATGMPCYFSNDIDGTDESAADATGTPEPGGLTVPWVEQLVQRLGDEVGVVGADLVEVAPVLANDGGARTLSTSVHYLAASFATLRAPLRARTDATEAGPAAVATGATNADRDRS